MLPGLLVFFSAALVGADAGTGVAAVEARQAEVDLVADGAAGDAAAAEEAAGTAEGTAGTAEALGVRRVEAGDRGEVRATGEQALQDAGEKLDAGGTPAGPADVPDVVGAETGDAAGLGRKDAGETSPEASGKADAFRARPPDGRFSGGAGTERPAERDEEADRILVKYLHAYCNRIQRVTRDEMRQVSGRLDSLEEIVREKARPDGAEAVSGLAGELAGVARLLKVLLALVALLVAAFAAAAWFAIWRGRAPAGSAAGPGAGKKEDAPASSVPGAGPASSAPDAPAPSAPDAGPGAADGVARRRIEGEEHKVFIGMATDLFRLRNNLDKIDDGQPGKRQAQKALERMETTLRARGYTFESPLGLPYNDGMAFQASFVVDESLPAGKSVITRVSSPQVNYRGRMVQSASGTVSMH